MSIISFLLDILGWAFMLIGVFMLITSAIGCLRFPDFFTRLHAASIGDVAGTVCVLLGIILHQGFNAFTAKICLLILFLLITNPVTSHALAKAAIAAGLQPDISTQKDQEN